MNVFLILECNFAVLKFSCAVLKFNCAVLKFSCAVLTFDFVVTTFAIFILKFNFVGFQKLLLTFQFYFVADNISYYFPKNYAIQLALIHKTFSSNHLFNFPKISLIQYYLKNSC